MCHDVKFLLSDLCRLTAGKKVATVVSVDSTLLNRFQHISFSFCLAGFTPCRFMRLGRAFCYGNGRKNDAR